MLVVLASQVAEGFFFDQLMGMMKGHHKGKDPCKKECRHYDVKKCHPITKPHCEHKFKHHCVTVYDEQCEYKKEMNCTGHGYDKVS